MVDHTVLGQVSQHLDDEERIAIGFAADGIGQAQGGGVERVTGKPLHEQCDAGVVEARQFDSGRLDVESSQRSEQLYERARTLKLGVPVRPDDKQTATRVLTW